MLNFLFGDKVTTTTRTITKTTSEKVYSREEVERLCRNALHSTRPNMNICMEEDANKWIKENL